MDRTVRKRHRHRHAGKAAVGGGGPAPRQLRADIRAVLAAGSRPDLPALRRSAVSPSAARAGESRRAGGRRGSRVDDPTAYHAEGVLYLTPNARFDHLLRPAGRRRTSGKAVNEAMRGHREAQPAARRRPAQDLPDFHQHAAQETAQEGLRDSRDARLRRLRPDLRILPRRVRPHGRAEGRRVLHAEQHRPAARRSPRAVPRPHPRPRLRLRRHVRAERPLRRASTRRIPPPNCRSTAQEKVDDTVASAA